MPTVDEKYDVLKVNQNWQKIDDGYGTLNNQNNQLTEKFHNSQITSVSNLTTYFATYKIGIARVNTTVGNALSGHNRQGIVVGFEISNEYDGFMFLDSNGDVYSGYITIASGTVTYHAL